MQIIDALQRLHDESEGYEPKPPRKPCILSKVMKTHTHTHLIITVCDFANLELYDFDCTQHLLQYMKLCTGKKFVSDVLRIWNQSDK